MEILLIGAHGQVGWELARCLAPLGSVWCADHRDSALKVDLADPDQVRALVRQVQPRLICNAAAYTAVDRAESETELAQRINADAVAVLGEEAARLDAAVVHYSTDYVYDGNANTPYTEDTPPAPLNAYGRTKLAGDRALAQSGAAHLILRTSWVYSRRGQNFLRTVLRLAEGDGPLRIVDDQIGAPTWARLIAEATAQIVHALRLDRGLEACRERSGVYHLTCGGAVSWCGFARAILERTAPARVPALQPIPSSDYPTPAVRPRYSVLSNARLEETFGIRLPEWERALDLCLDSALRAPC